MTRAERLMELTYKLYILDWTMNNERPSTPELERLRVVKNDSQKIGEFLDWLEHQVGLRLCDQNGEETQLSKEKLLAKYFEIDLEKVEQERVALLDYQRKLNGDDG